MRLRFRQWLALPRAARMTVLAMMLALPLISLCLHRFGYVRTRQWIERASARTVVRRTSPGDIVAGERLARLAAIAGKHGFVKATCLRQALLVHFLLRRKGLSPEFRIGVRRNEGILNAHAWVQLGGIDLGQEKLPYTPFTKRASHRRTA